VLVRFLFAFLAIGGCAYKASPQSTLIIQKVNVITPDRPDIQYDVDVAITDGRITAIGRNLQHNENTELLNGDGLYLTPGLIDSHVHLYHATGLKRRYTEDYDALYHSYMAQLPRSYLYFGYTTLIELNADFETNARFEQSLIKPRLYHCDQGVVLPDGFMALEYEDGGITNAFPNFLYDSYRGGPFPAGFDPQEHTPEAVVHNIISKGGVCVKLYYEQALWWPGRTPEFALPTVEIFIDVVTAARASDIPVILHATTPAGHQVGLDAGVDILAHGPWEWPGVRYDRSEPPAEVEDIMNEIALGDAALQPTMQTLRNTASMFDPASLNHPALQNVLPQGYIDYLASDGQAQRDVFVSIFGPAFRAMHDLDVGAEAQPVDLRQLQLTYNARYERMVGAMQANGAKLLFGTDTAVGGFGWGNPPGLNGFLEMKGWSRAGIPLRTIFEAATIDNAEAFGLANDLGTVSPGKRADLLLMRGNPLEDISAYDTIEIVIINGRPIAREQLSAINSE